MKIGKRLILGFMGISLLVALVAATAIIRNEKVQGIVEKEIYISCSHLDSVWQLMECIEHQHIAADNYLLGGILEGERANYFEEKERFNRLLEEYCLASCEHVKDTLDELNKKSKVYNEKLEEIFELYRQGADIKSIRKEMDEVGLIEEDIHENYLKKIIKHVQEEHVEKAKEDIAKLMSNTNKIVWAVAIISLLLAIAIGYLISKNITAPLTKLEFATTEIAMGKLDAKIEVDSKDEIGQLGASFQKMAEEIKKTRNELLIAIADLKDAKAELEKESESLEKKVEKRTKDLSESQEALLNMMEDLEEAKAYIENVVANFLDSLVVLNMDGTIKTINQIALDLLDYKEIELIGKHIKTIFANEEGVLLLDKLNTDSGIGDIINYEISYKKKDNMSIPVILSASIMNNKDGKPIGMVMIAKDITERKQAEEEKEKMQNQLLQLQKMEAVGTLTGGVAHDFNNLLTAIQGNAELAMMKADKNDTFYKNLEKICQVTERAANLTGQLLLFSRKQPMEFTLFNINGIIDDMLTMLERLIGEDIVINTDLASDLWPIRADRGNIEQVIMNLTVNARDAMPRGGNLTIKTENITLDEEYSKRISYARPGRFTCLSVEDTGIGIDKETVQHIFEPFFSTKGVGEGTGLGLSVVYGVVKQHEGWINVYSEPGQGTLFKIYLPAVFGESKLESEIKERASLEDFQGNGQRVLLVEDAKEVREFAAASLRENNYLVFEAGSTKEALDVFKSEKGEFDLVFSDVVLPDQSGLKLVEQLLSQKQKLPVLLCSGYMDDKSQWPIIKEKGFTFLQKPYTLANLLKVVKEVIGGKK